MLIILLPERQPIPYTFEMQKPVPKRRNDFDLKMAYVESRRQELLDSLFAAKENDVDPKFLSQAAADIVGNARECFDYLGQDILECFILPSSPKLQADHASGKMKAYFPFHDSQLTNAKGVFHNLNAINKPLYQDLRHFTQQAASGGTIDQTLFKYSGFLEMKEMVNAKKHNQLVEVQKNPGQEYLIKHGGMQIILPIKDQVGWNNFSTPANATVKLTPEYRFLFNDREVGDFCMFAGLATDRVIKKFYLDYFS